MEISKDSFFNPVKLTAAQKAAGTHETAMRIIDDEVTAREHKTARFRQLRQTHEAKRPPASPKVRRARAKLARADKAEITWLFELAARRLGYNRQQNLKPKSPSRRVSLKRLAGPVRGVHSTEGSTLHAETHV